jgi:predicted flavoprotein YhiN
VIVVGAGAAGLVAAAFAARAGADVTLIERTRDGGRKILISGGGRCNVLPSVAAPERFVTDSPAHLLRSMLRAWPLHEQRAFFEQDLAIPLALEHESGKLFPRSDRARDVRDGLTRHARECGAICQFDTVVEDVLPSADGFTVSTSRGDLTCARLVLATGGLSVPATGSDGIGLRIARALGHAIVEPYAALTPLLASPPRALDASSPHAVNAASPHAVNAASPHESLSGISLTVRLRSKAGTSPIETHGGFLFTHRGYSGPGVLDISHVTTRGNTPPIRVQWSGLDANQWQAALAAGDTISATLSRHLPSRLGEQLMRECDIPLDRRVSSLRREERVALIEALTSYELPWSGNEGFKKAEVTGGGVGLAEVDPKTLESRTVKGLYLCGEMLDAFGPIGGHNFSWAWATGRAAGRAAGNVR